MRAIAPWLFGFVLLALLLVAAVWLGRGWGLSQQRGSREQLEALKLSFDQLLSQLELTASHNIEVMGKKTGEMTELLRILDQKTLHLHDLMDQAEKVPAEVPPSLRNLANDVATGLRLKRELQETITRIDGRLHQLQRLEGDLDRRQTDLHELIDALPDPGTISNVVSLRPVVGPTASDTRGRRPDGAGPVAAAAPPAPANLSSSLALREGPLALARPTAGQLLAPTAPAPRPTLPPLPPPPPRSALPPPLAPRSGGSDAGHRADEPGQELPEIGTNHRSVLDLHTQGVAIPQIARQLQIQRGEVQLILQLYGQTAHLRRVM